MEEVTIRKANVGDARLVAGMIRGMLADMACLGGYSLAQDSGVWDQLEADIQTGISEEDHLYLLAEMDEVDRQPVGLVEARVVFPHQLFEQKRMLHIHALYVLPEYRRQAIGGRLLRGALDWGKENGCVEAGLHTLLGSPALNLYEKMGFTVFEYKMTHRL